MTQQFEEVPAQPTVKQEIDYSLALMGANKNFMGQFAAGKSSGELKHGEFRLSEALRRVAIQKRDFHEPGVFTGLYKRANSIKEVNQNNRVIAEESAKRRLKYRSDQDDGLIFARQLEEIDARIFDKKYQPLGMWRKLVSSRGFPLGANRVTYRLYDGTGEVEPVTVGRSDNIPYVGASGEEFSNKIIAKTIGYRYSLPELHAAAFANVPLENRYQKQVARAYETNLNKVMFNGDALEDLEGLTNLSGTTEIQAAAAAAGGNPRVWSDLVKTNDEVFADFLTLRSTIAQTSQYNYSYDTPMNVGVAPVPYKRLLIRMAAGTDTTLIDFILNAKELNIASISLIPEFAGAGQSATDMMMMIPANDDGEVIEANVGEGIIWQPPQFDGLDIKYPSMQYHGGLSNRYPIGIGIMWNI